MGRVLGKIENESIGTRFFIHCSTSGYSLPRLFKTSVEAWENYDENNTKPHEVAVLGLSKKLSVAEVFIAYGRSITSSDDIMIGPFFGLVTEDRLLLPTSEENRNISLLLIEGTLHIGKTIEGCFTGDYEASICESVPDNCKDIEVLSLSDYMDKPLKPLCQHCVALLTAS